MLIIDPKNLADALKVVRSLTNALYVRVAFAKTLTLSAYNDGAYCRIQVPTEGTHDKFICTVEIDLLQDAAKGDTMKMEFSEQLKITKGRSKLSLNTAENQDMPKYTSEGLELTPKSQALITAALKATAIDDIYSAQACTTVHVAASKGKLTVACYDSSHTAHYVIESKGTFEFSLPRSVWTMILSAVGGREYKLASLDSGVHVIGEGFEFHIPVLQSDQGGNLKAANGIIEKHFSGGVQLSVNNLDLYNTLRETISYYEVSAPVRIKVADGKMNIKAVNGRGTYSSSVPCKSKKSVEFSVDPTLALDVIRMLDETTPLNVGKSLIYASQNQDTAQASYAFVLATD